MQYKQLKVAVNISDALDYIFSQNSTDSLDVICVSLAVCEAKTSSYCLSLFWYRAK